MRMENATTITIIVIVIVIIIIIIIITLGIYTTEGIKKIIIIIIFYKAPLCRGTLVALADSSNQDFKRHFVKVSGVNPHS